MSRSVRSVRSRGFTLIELLVVIAIIAVLVAILLPAVQQAREAARKAQCQNNLKQIGIALHSYHETYFLFPYGLSVHGRCGAGFSVTNHTGWICLLPYIDQGNLFNKFDPTQATGNWNAAGGTLAGGGATATGNGILSSTRLANLLCPSDSGLQMLPNGFDGTSYGCVSGVPSYRSSYAFSVTGGALPAASCVLWSAEASATRALFGPASNSSLRDVKDGSSNTIAISETTLEVDDGRTASWACVQHVGGGVNFRDPPNYTINNWTCCTWRSPPNAQTQPNRLGEWGSPGSTHVGGLNVLMADGSIHFLSENLDAVVRQKIASISDGLPLSGFP